MSDLVWTQPKLDKRNHSKCHFLAVTNKRVNYLLASFLTAMSVSKTPHYHTYVLLQLCFADVREAEGEQRLPRSHVQHVVLLAEQQRGVVKDTVHGEPLGRPLLCVWKTTGKCTRDYYCVAGHRKGEQSGADHYSSEYKREHLKGMTAQLKRDQSAMLTLWEQRFCHLQGENRFMISILQRWDLKRMLGRVPKLFYTR